LGPGIVEELRGRGCRVTVFHRGVTAAGLPGDVERILGDRGVEADLRRAVGGRSFDMVVDTTLYTGPEAEVAERIFTGRVGRYLMLSTGQVYLVRTGVARPYREEDYDGPVMAAPEGADYGDWLYGVDKRAAEETLFGARDLPVTVLRLPMVHSVRDHYQRVGAYLGRLLDGGPIVVPAGERPRLKHIYGEDVVRCIGELARSGLGLGRAYNLSQEEAPGLVEFLGELARLAGTGLEVVAVERERLEALGLLLDCSPFSGRWMSALDNGRSRQELGIRYTEWREYLPALVERLLPKVKETPPRYSKRAAELALLSN
jgi:nucleoside-diphosphate-sugar epimerase